MGDFIKKYEFVLVFFMGLTYYLYDFYFSTDEFDPTNIGLVLIGIGMIGFVGKQLYNNRKKDEE
jgi:predicted MFS family arabinose efflux permease